MKFITFGMQLDKTSKIHNLNNRLRYDIYSI